MISQLQNIQAFVAKQLTDIVDWSKHVRVDPDHKTTGDQAYIVIATGLNRYKLSVASAYIEPPAGAPLACRSLGTVTFYDPVQAKTIVGPKADATYAEISKHLHVRELTDGLAVAQRELAEAKPENAGAARVKHAEIAERAGKWGVGAKTETSAADRNGPMIEAHTIAVAELPPQGHGDWPMTNSQGPRPFLGAPVIFIANPGEQISGMGEIPGICVKTFPSSDRISIFMMPDHSEPSYRDSLPRRGSSAGNGKTHQFNCWDFNPHFVREQKRLEHLEEAIAKMADEANADRALIDELKARLDGDKPKGKRAKEAELIS